MRDQNADEKRLAVGQDDDADIVDGIALFFVESHRRARFVDQGCFGGQAVSESFGRDHGIAHGSP